MRILALHEWHLCLKIALRYVYAENFIRVMDTIWMWIIFFMDTMTCKITIKEKMGGYHKSLAGFSPPQLKHLIVEIT